jgi:mono/diheme cytochrome c family protein
MVSPASAKPAPLNADANLKEYAAKPGDTNAHFTFNLTNISSAPVLINFVRTSCGCTVAKLPSTPWKLEPGSNGPIQVTVDLRGKLGTITKSVTVESDQGSKMVQVKVVMPPTPASMTNNVERARNMEIAKTNRRAIFQGECATCHVTPAIGKSGKELYVAACGICHDADNRATSVPDLYALTVPTDPAYWRKWITTGKEGGMMPGFAKEEGGPLNEEQMGSLVHYLSRNFNPLPIRRSVVLPLPAAPQ